MYPATSPGIQIFPFFPLQGQDYGWRPVEGGWAVTDSGWAVTDSGWGVTDSG